MRNKLDNRVHDLFDRDAFPDEPNTVSFPNTECVEATARSIRVKIPFDNKGPNSKTRYVWAWIPQSQVTDDSEVWKPGDQGKLVITEWIAEQKGLV